MKEVGARQTDKKGAKIIHQGEPFRAQREREKKIKVFLMDSTEK